MIRPYRSHTLSLSLTLLPYAFPSSTGLECASPVIGKMKSVLAWRGCIVGAKGNRIGRKNTDVLNRECRIDAAERLPAFLRRIICVSDLCSRRQRDLEHKAARHNFSLITLIVYIHRKGPRETEVLNLICTIKPNVE